MQNNIHMRPKPTERELDDHAGWCAECLEECTAIASDCSFDDGLGTVYDYEIVSDCCEDTILEDEPEEVEDGE